MSAAAPSSHPSRLEMRPLGVGCGSLANADGAAAFRGMVDRAMAAGVGYFDTAALYLDGDSERRLGAALRPYPRTRFVVSTKTGRQSSGYDYSAAHTLASVEASLARLGLDHVDLVMIHDLSRPIHGARYERRVDEAMRGAYEALTSLRRDGTVGAIGIAAMDWASCLDLARLGAFDAVMAAGQYTLLHRDCEPLLAHCARRGIAFIAASPFNSGILATGAVDGALHHFGPASAEILDRVRRIEAVCARHGVPLAAAALQFPRRHPAVSSVVVGCRTAAELDGNLALAALPVPQAMWDDLTEMGQ